MENHEFTLVLAVDDLSDDQCNSLYEAGCDDGTISSSECVTRIDSCREAASLGNAIRSAIANVNAAGIGVARVEINADALFAE